MASAKRAHRRDRGQGRAPEKLTAPTSDYRDEQGNVLTLRGSLTAGARREYAQTLGGAGSRPAATQQDVAQRAFELLFERLAVRWEIAGAAIERQRELLARLRAADQQERAFVRGALREHCAENFPEVQVP
ncbi:MAG TPA: hypothetical protein VGP17_10435 [Solirubrobacteraceae bacterium]|nr:hypothetical protein [Solirubrobacteraceae bacterium]